MLSRSHPGSKSMNRFLFAVYGSYSCDEVLKLRKFRDNTLSKYFFGKQFIRLYYFLSPTLAKHIRKSSVVGKIIRKFLDYVVARM